MATKKTQKIITRLVVVFFIITTAIWFIASIPSFFQSNNDTPDTTVTTVTQENNTNLDSGSSSEWQEVNLEWLEEGEVIEITGQSVELPVVDLAPTIVE